MSLIVVSPGRSPQRFDRKLMNVLAIAGLAASLAACTSDVSLSDFNVVNKLSNLSATNPLSFQAARDYTLRPITSEDLVGPQGQCASAGLPPSVAEVGADGQPVATPALMQSGIALQMTECEVVQRAGGPDGIEFGSDGGERSVVLTYTRGARPGVYRFAGGRLVSIERGAEPPAPAPPQKKSAPAKKRPPA